MSEEEKENLEKMIKYIERQFNSKLDYEIEMKFNLDMFNVLNESLNLIERQQKEIEKYEKQIDLEFVEDNYIEKKVLDNYISKNKIREKLDYQYELWNTPNKQKEYNLELAETLEELLGEE